MNDNIKTFPGAQDLPENPLRMTAHRHGICNHSEIIIDRHTRSIQCANTDCCASLDPFNFLAANGQAVARAWASYKDVMSRVHEIAERVSALKKEEQRLRAMLKRVQEKTGAKVSIRD